MKSMSNNILSSGGNIYLSSKIEKIKKINNKTYININSSKAYDYIINCTGLQADINYKKFSKEKRKMKIVPFRGEYYTLTEGSKKLVVDSNQNLLELKGQKKWLTI